MTATTTRPTDPTDTLAWDFLDTERSRLRAWVVDNADKYEALAERIATGHDRLEGALRMEADDDTVAAIRGRLKQLEYELVDANVATRKLFIIRVAQLAKSLLGEVTMTIDGVTVR